jgi:hypothetical protein
VRLPPFKSYWSFLGSILATISLVLSLVILDQNYEGSWGGFAIFLFNLPISAVILILGDKLGFAQVPFIIAAGVAQWYLVGWAIGRAFKAFKAERSH